MEGKNDMHIGGTEDDPRDKSEVLAEEIKKAPPLKRLLLLLPFLLSALIGVWTKSESTDAFIGWVALILGAFLSSRSS